MLWSMARHGTNMVDEGSHALERDGRPSDAGRASTYVSGTPSVRLTTISESLADGWCPVAQPDFRKMLGELASEKMAAEIAERDRGPL